MTGAARLGRNKRMHVPKGILGQRHFEVREIGWTEATLMSGMSG